MITIVARKIRTLLIVEDDDLRESIKHNLSSDGFTVFTVADGLSGIEAARKHKLRLILLDVTTGLEQIVLALRLNHNTSHIPIFTVTDTNSIESKGQESDVTVDSYVTKASIGENLAEIVKFKLENYEAIMRRPERKARQGKRILVIDDEEDVRKLAIYALHQYGFEAYTAADGPSGIRAARRYKPHAILLDVMMPGMDGWEVLANLKWNKKTKHIPVFLLSGHNTVNDIDEAFVRRADDFIAKPFDGDTLGKIIEGKLRGARK
jgi:DNA-binding response OmpR family regulator